VERRRVLHRFFCLVASSLPCSEVRREGGREGGREGCFIFASFVRVPALGAPVGGGKEGITLILLSCGIALFLPRGK